MKKQHAILSFLFLVPAFLFGQVKFSKDFKVTTATPFEVVDGKSKEYFPDGNGNTISVKTDGELVTIQRLSVDGMKEISRKQYKDFPEYTDIQNVLRTGNKLYYIYTTYSKKDEIFSAFSREVDMSNGTFKSPVALFKTGGPIVRGSMTENIGIWGMQGGPHLNVLSSFDGSKVLINYRRKPLNKKDSENYDILGFYVFDSAMSKVWGEEVKMPHTEADMNNLAYSVTKDGVAHMLAYIKGSKEFEMINIDNGDLKTHRLDVDGDLVFQSFTLQEDPSGNLVCSGYYAQGLDVKVSWTGNAALSYNINGIKHFKVDKNGKTLDSFDYEFPVALINQYESERTKEKNEDRDQKGKAGIADLKMRDVIVNPDGSTVFVGEQYFLRTSGYGSNQSTSYNYADVIVSKVDKSGKLMWHKKLPKTQVGSAGKGGMGIKFIQAKDACYVLYLDNVKNASIGMDQVPVKHLDGKGGFLSAYKLDNTTGDVTKHTIFDITDVKGIEAFQFNTSRIFDVSSNIFMLEVYMKGKKDTMIKMEL